jgi:hypothetical protein
MEVNFMRMHSRILLAGMATLVAAGAWAGELGVGMKAPKLEVAKWFKGKPVTLDNGKTLTVIEFWATW